MKFAKSELLGIARAENGWLYDLDFFGEDEGAAVVSGPKPLLDGVMTQVPEVHRESATNAADARAKLETWVHERGWTWTDLVARRA